MRRAAKVDANQAAVVADLRALGWTVEDCSGFGEGWPDLFVSIGPGMSFAPPSKLRGILNADGFGVFVEVKGKGGTLTPAQQTRMWTKTRAPLIVAETAEEVVDCIAQIRAARKGR